MSRQPGITRKTYEFIKSHQRQFPVEVLCRLLRMRPPLNLFFPLKRIRRATMLFAVNQFHRQPFRGEVRPYPVLIFPQAFHQVLGATDVKGAVGTFEDVEVGHNIPLLLVD